MGLAGRLRVAGRIAAMAMVLIACLPFHYAWRLARVPSPWPRIFLAAMARVAGMRATIRGSPAEGPTLFLANHTSWLDIMLIAGATGAAFVSRDDVARWPVAGWLARMNRTIFVARADRGAVRGQADALRAALERGGRVALFPEGTTDGGVAVLPFRPSLLASLFPPIPGVSVQPVAIDYGGASADIAWTGQEKAVANVKRVLARRGSNLVTLDFLTPIDPAAAGDRKALAEAARDAIGESLVVSPLPSAAGGDGL